MQKVTLSTDLKSGFFWTQMMLSIIQNPHLNIHKELDQFSCPDIFIFDIFSEIKQMFGIEKRFNSLCIFKCGFYMIDNII